MYERIGSEREYDQDALDRKLIMLMCLVIVLFLAWNAMTKPRAVAIASVKESETDRVSKSSPRLVARDENAI
jgi:hypothetical protein